ncbi:ImmA/IrrE family metallo-endopeptidase, partial [Myxococcus vastator]|uniref:ImmA/IrrE family metallo-endopeptidase n=1 Tax=Myxococcus vastator TaxID=2709664 RepID=UPI0013D35422
MNKVKFDSDWIPPPGATVADLISRGTAHNSHRAIVEHLGSKKAEMLFEGHLELDSKLASFLADTVGLSVSFWLEREKIYRADLVQRQAEKQLLDQLPLDEMRARSFIQPVHSHAETIAEVVQFFGKEDPKSCRETIEQLPTLVRQKTSRALTSHPGSLAVWLRAGELEATRTECADWSPKKLRELLPEFRKLTRTEDPRRFLPKIKSLCQACGIAFVVSRATSGCRARGAVRLLSATKIMLLLSFRHLSDDQFWFTFFHELGHLLL